MRRISPAFALAAVVLLPSLAVANELMRAYLSFDTWLTLKVWGVTAVSFAFAIANMPMLLRHGLDPDKKSEAITDTPVE